MPITNQICYLTFLSLMFLLYSSNNYSITLSKLSIKIKDFLSNKTILFFFNLRCQKFIIAFFLSMEYKIYYNLGVLSLNN